MDSTMKRVYSSLSAAQCNLLKSVLESRGIPCAVRNEIVSGLAGRVPFTEVWPELWVLDDRQFEEARQILEEATQNETESGDV
jgi:hypothetical protein